MISNLIRSLKPLNISKVGFILSCVLLVFAYGVSVGRYRIFPYTVINFFYDSAIRTGEALGELGMITGIRPSFHLKPARYAGEGVTRLDRNRAVPGLTFITGFFDGGLELRLMELDGTVVNRWRPLFSSIFPNPTHLLPEYTIPI